jgi:hypothetical protein
VTLSSPSRAGALVALALALAAPPARGEARRRFEPTDLDLQPPGVLELDSQVGFTEGESAGRVVVPDLEASLGLAPNVQLEIDAAYAVEGPPVGRFALDHPAPDNLWLSTKVGFGEVRDDAAGRVWAFGAQLGPKAPLAPGAHGAGYEAMAIVGLSIRRVHLAFDAGGFVDPAPDGTRRRSTAIEGGVDLDWDLDAKGVWSLVAELGAARYFSGEDPQAHATCGLTWGPTPDLDLTVSGLLGFLSGGDRGGVLLGVTPRFAMWR